MHGRRQQGGSAPLLDVYAWYRYNRYRLNSAIFRSFYAIFQYFFPLFFPLEIFCRRPYINALVCFKVIDVPSSVSH